MPVPEALPGRYGWLAARLAAFENALLVILLSTMVVTAGGQIIMRNLFSFGLPWADSMIRVLVLWLALVGAVIATRERQHIGIDLLVRFLPPRLARWLQHLVNLFAALVCSLVAMASVLLVQMEREDGQLAFARVPVWVCELIIPIAFAAMAVHFLLHTFRSPRDARD